MEDNFFCRFWGRAGIFHANNRKARRYLLGTGLIFNTVAFILTFYSAFSISNKYSILRATSFSHGVLVPKTENYIWKDGFQFDAGLRAVAVDGPLTDEETVTPFDEFCDLPNDSVQAVLAKGSASGEGSCLECGEVSGSMVRSIILSVISFIPTLSTDVLRMYPNYDVNCQKSFATFFATFTLVLSFITLRQYERSCHRGFYEGDIYLTYRLEAIDPETGDLAEADLVATLTWRSGPGLRCLYAGTILKIVDIICNVLIKAPKIARDHSMQLEYEEVHYSERAPAGSPIVQGSGHDAEDDDVEIQDNNVISANENGNVTAERIEESMNTSSSLIRSPRKASSKRVNLDDFS